MSSSPPSEQRNMTTPPPRPRLLVRPRGTRVSPPPPARLTPLTPTTPVLSSPATEKSGGRLNARQRDEVRRNQEVEERHASTEAARSAQLASSSSTDAPGAAAAASGGWWNASSTPPPSSLHHAAATAAPPHPLPRHSSYGLPPTHTSNSAPSSVRASPLSGAHPALMTAATPPRPECTFDEKDGGDWFDHGRVEGMLSTKRERFASSADTQNSTTSSTTPPPRCRRAVGDHSLSTPASQKDASSSSVVLSYTIAQHVHRQLDTVACDSLQLPEETAVRAATQTSAPAQQSRGHTASCSNSDGSVPTPLASTSPSLPPPSEDHVAVTAVQAPVSIGRATAAECLVLDDSVDSTAIVSPEQLQHLLQEASAQQATRSLCETPLPYRHRLITAEVLRDWTGWEDLDLVLTTQLRLDAEIMIGVEQIGKLLPRLLSLKLNGSRIPRVRQLGTGFHTLKYLWLNSCQVHDLRGLAACCPALEELYVSFNHLRDVTPVVELAATLKVLDLEGNLVEDVGTLSFVLAALTSVTTLSLQGNPITCEHQGRVRAAYVEELSTDAARHAGHHLPQTMGFSAVLQGWVKALMPQLHYLNDAPLLESKSELDKLSPMHTAFSVHVDPLDVRLAEELRLVEACVRDTAPFDPLLEAVAASNQQMYSRPSTSCNGARPRLVPTTSLGSSVLSSASAWSSSNKSTAAQSRRLGEAAVTLPEASRLTTGAVLSGKPTASLRRRLAASSRENSASSAAAAEETRAHDVLYRHSLGNDGPGSPPNGLGADEDARVVALLADDSEEDEWERFKAALLLQRPPSSTSAAGAAAVSDTVAAVPGAAEKDGFDTELKAELNRLRMRMAKAGRD